MGQPDRSSEIKRAVGSTLLLLYIPFHPVSPASTFKRPACSLGRGDVVCWAHTTILLLLLLLRAVQYCFCTSGSHQNVGKQNATTRQNRAITCHHAQHFLGRQAFAVRSSPIFSFFDLRLLHHRAAHEACRFDFCRGSSYSMATIFVLGLFVFILSE